MNNKSKKTMSIWQLIMGLGLSIMILISMFLPRLHLSVYKSIDITEDVSKAALQKIGEVADLFSDYIGDYDVDDGIDEIEDEMDEARDDAVNKETSMSSAKMIFAKDRQYAKLISGLQSGSSEDATYDSIKEYFNGIGDKMLGFRILIALIMFLQIDVIVVYLVTFIRKNKNYLAAFTTMISSVIIIITNVVWYVAAPIAACNILMNKLKKADIWDTGIIEKLVDDKKSTFYPIFMKEWFRLTGVGGHLLLVCGFIMLVFAFLLLIFGKRVGSAAVVGYSNTWNVQPNVGPNNGWNNQEIVGNGNGWNNQEVVGNGNGWNNQGGNHGNNQWENQQQMHIMDGPVGLGNSGGLEALYGCMAGAKLDCASGEQIVVGRDPAVSELVLTNVKVSRRHFVMQYEQQKGGYQIFCYSKNGLLLSDGRMIGEKQTAFAKSGTVITLADGEEQLRLR